MDTRSIQVEPTLRPRTLAYVNIDSRLCKNLLETRIRPASSSFSSHDCSTKLLTGWLRSNDNTTFVKYAVFLAASYHPPSPCLYIADPAHNFGARYRICAVKVKMVTYGYRYRLRGGCDRWIGECVGGCFPIIFHRAHKVEMKVMKVH